MKLVAAIVSALVLVGCGGSDSSGTLFDGRDPAVDAGTQVDSSPGVTPAQDAAPAPDSGTQTPESGVEPAPDGAAPVPSDSGSVDPCSGTIAYAHQQGFNCGVYDNCDLGVCSANDICGGSTTVLDSPPNVCGDTCLDESTSIAVSGCTQASVPGNWVVAQGCTYAYRVANGAPTYRTGGTSGCVQETSTVGGTVLCCP